jgi:hypothetical protein
MRRVIFILMIALLPLRGWIGDAMATQMAAHSAVHSASGASAEDRHDRASTPAASHVHESGEPAGHDHDAAVSVVGTMPPDCVQHGADSSVDHANTGCENCALCQACSTVALTETGSSAAAAFVIGPVPRASATQFASAEPAPGQKPPIS